MLRLYPENFEQENARLFKAAEEANFPRIVRHVYAGASLNALDDDGLTALMKVIKARNMTTFVQMFMALYREAPVLKAELLEPKVAEKVVALQEQATSKSFLQKLLYMNYQEERRLDFMCPLDITLCNLDGFTTVDMLKAWNRTEGKKWTSFVEQMEAKESAQRQKNVKLYTAVVKDKGSEFSCLLADGADVDAGVAADESARCAAMRFGRTDILSRIEGYELNAKKEAMAIFLKDGSTLALKTLLQDPVITYDAFEKNDEAWGVHDFWGALGCVPERRLRLFKEKSDEEFDKMFNYTPERKKSAADFRQRQRNARLCVAPSYE